MIELWCLLCVVFRLLANILVMSGGTKALNKRHNSGRYVGVQIGA
jgi:hypothetical protein